ncbi:1-(5-phosphoribosyl)-5-((5-phosphoribosylamino)methylideneamino)imidazole-4-carboxamide isomerase [Halothiobacillus diazotrophicus]|uniref:1-(5-phosphoribosyl)-5-((5-phosphoribosylamino)methylideneamino)imidazole-4-carboxamide isomerase n=1 Tax=Halothiobacillus diazotrophicus TaxID=1860122 RepID=A0A191ZFX2_9GAMM|nr:DUF971 domain-containing protein [Halothiobacillus diazotrophicus]ANJ66752.1 1-(5-phosphoribosyl)-5-((5-phosphoribosylamino)methylideneamino)imidazole-4-carboxamide isomerase [Halothiobacillus diazotrophicus]
MQHSATELKFNKTEQTLFVRFADDVQGTLSSEFLRVFSPSAEVRGHGGGEPMLVLGKEQVRIVALEPVGRYAVKLVFDDGHDSGLYDWDTLHELCVTHDSLWQNYLERLTAVGLEHGAPQKPATVKITDVLAESGAKPNNASRSDS